MKAYLSDPPRQGHAYRMTSIKKRVPVWLAGLIAIFTVNGCTTVGVNTRDRTTIDYGTPIVLHVCVLQAAGVPAARAEELLRAVGQEFEPYGIQIVVPWQRSWARPGFTHESLFDDVAHRDLEPPCDRLVALVDRNSADFLWGLVLPEILGQVDVATHTRGYIVATMVSLNQILEPPSAAAIHEFYHLLGCPHAASLTKCYRLIADLKRHTDTAKGFVPGIGPNGQFLMTRAEANAQLHMAMTVKDVHPQGFSLEDWKALDWRSECPLASVTERPESVASHRGKPRVVICACMDETGSLTQNPMVSVSSGLAKFDGAAIKLAAAASGLYTDGLTDRKPPGRCQRVALTFGPINP